MAQKIMCLKCNKGMVGIFDGKLLTVKRKGVAMVVSGKASDLLVNCPKCGEVNSINLLQNDEGKVNMETSGKVEEITFDEILKINENKEESNEKDNTEGGEQKSEEGGEGGEPKTEPGINYVKTT